MFQWNTSAHELKVIADTLKDVLTECWLVFDVGIISLHNVDPEKVISVEFKLYPDHTTYACTTKMVFAIYIQTLYRLLRNSKNTDTAILENTSDNKLKITVLAHGKFPKHTIYVNPLNTPLPQYMKIHTEPELEIVMNTSQLYYILHDLASLSTQVRITTQRHLISFSAKDEAGTSSEYEQTFSQLDLDSTATYLVKYLEKFCKPGLRPTIQVQIRKNAPLTLVYLLDHGSLSLSIAQLG